MASSNTFFAPTRVLDRTSVPVFLETTYAGWHYVVERGFKVRDGICESTFRVTPDGWRAAFGETRQGVRDVDCMVRVRCNDDVDSDVARAKLRHERAIYAHLGHVAGAAFVAPLLGTLDQGGVTLINVYEDALSDESACITLKSLYSVDACRTLGVTLEAITRILVNALNTLHHVHLARVTWLDDIRPEHLAVDVDTWAVRICGGGISATTLPRPWDDTATELTLHRALAYASPEHLTQARASVDERSDVYSLGLVILEWLMALQGLPVRVENTQGTSLAQRRWSALQSLFVLRGVPDREQLLALSPLEDGRQFVQAVAQHVAMQTKHQQTSAADIRAVVEGARRVLPSSDAAAVWLTMALGRMLEYDPHLRLVYVSP